MKNTNRKILIKINSKLDLFFAIVFAALLLFQIITVITYAPKDTIVFKNVHVATYVYENGSLAAGSPLMNLYGLIARLFKVHPLKLIFTILPAPMLVLYYFGYYVFLGRIFEESRKVYAALCFAALINIWGYWCEALTSFSLLMCWYSDAAFVLHGLLIVIGIFVCTFAKEKNRDILSASQDDLAVAQESEDEEYLEEWDMHKHKIINARNLAIALGIMVILLVAVTMVLNKKINDLYAATVNLQDDLNSRCSVYEFTPEGSEVAGYLLKGAEGSLTFIGGGDAENAEKLSEFLQKYGTDITNWYVYGESEQDCGALNEIMQSSSINIENVYVLERKDINTL